MNQWNLARHIPKALLLPYISTIVNGAEQNSQKAFTVSAKGMFQEGHYLFPEYAQSASEIETHRLYSMLAQGSLRIQGARDVRSLGDQVTRFGTFEAESLLEVTLNVSEIGRIKETGLYTVEGLITAENGASLWYNSLFETNEQQFEYPDVTEQTGNGLFKSYSESKPETTHKRDHTLAQDWNVRGGEILQPQVFKSTQLMIKNSMETWKVNYHSLLGIQIYQPEHLPAGTIIKPTLNLHLVAETDTHALFKFDYSALRGFDYDRTKVEGMVIGTKRDDFSFGKKQKTDSDVITPKSNNKDGFLPPTTGFKPPSSSCDLPKKWEPNNDSKDE